MGVDVGTWAIVREGGAATVLFIFLIFFAKSYLKNTAKIADDVATSTTQHIQALTQVKDALNALTLQVMRNSDIVLRCKGQQPDKPDKED